MLDKSKFSLVITEILFERIPYLKQLWMLIDGKKTIIGRALLTVVAVLDALQYIYPQLPLLQSIHAGSLTIVSWFFVEFGLRHKTLKIEKEVLTLE